MEYHLFLKDLIDNTRGERSQERPPKNEESVLKLFVINVVLLFCLRSLAHVSGIRCR